MRLAKQTQKCCSDCGTAFECGMGQDTPCWCSREFAPVMRLPESGADCYCANCLAKHIALGKQENLKSPP
jgi:Cysteine-rich CWC